MITIEMPFPPSVNHYWGSSGRRRFVSKRGKEFQRDVAIAWAASGHKTLEGPIELYVAALFPDNRRRDLDNLLKATQDALEHAGAYEDDGQIHRLAIWREGVEDGGRLVVQMQPLGDQGKTLIVVKG